jgi:DNA-directed RNA polymerase beta' subunit
MQKKDNQKRNKGVALMKNNYASLRVHASSKPDAHIGAYTQPYASTTAYNNHSVFGYTTTWFSYITTKWLYTNQLAFVKQKSKQSNNIKLKSINIEKNDYPLSASISGKGSHLRLRLAQAQESTQFPIYTSYSKMDEVKLVTIGLASANRIRQWAEKTLPNGKVVGEVTNANTLHHKTFKPQKGGLFCERIFGPLKDFECACGNGKKGSKRDLKKTKDKNGILLKVAELLSNQNQKNPLRGLQKESQQNNILMQTSSFGHIKDYKRFFCSKCDVEFTWSVIRRYQLGFIHLNAPVTHVWYVKGNPSYISLLLDMKKKHVEYVTYCSETLTLENSLKGEQFYSLMETPNDIYTAWEQASNKPKIGFTKTQLLQEPKVASCFKHKNWYYFKSGWDKRGGGALSAFKKLALKKTSNLPKKQLSCNLLLKNTNMDCYMRVGRGGALADTHIEENTNINSLQLLNKQNTNWSQPVAPTCWVEPLKKTNMLKNYSMPIDSATRTFNICLDTRTCMDSSKNSSEAINPDSSFLQKQKILSNSQTHLEALKKYQKYFVSLVTKKSKRHDDLLFSSSRTSPQASAKVGPLYPRSGKRFLVAQEKKYIGQSPSYADQQMPIGFSLNGVPFKTVSVLNCRRSPSVPRIINFPLSKTIKSFNAFYTLDFLKKRKVGVGVSLAYKNKQNNKHTRSGYLLNGFSDKPVFDKYINSLYKEAFFTADIEASLRLNRLIMGADAPSFLADWELYKTTVNRQDTMHNSFLKTYSNDTANAVTLNLTDSSSSATDSWHAIPASFYYLINILKKRSLKIETLRKIKRILYAKIDRLKQLILQKTTNNNAPVVTTTEFDFVSRTGLSDSDKVVTHELFNKNLLLGFIYAEHKREALKQTSTRSAKPTFDSITIENLLNTFRNYDSSQKTKVFSKKNFFTLIRWIYIKKNIDWSICDVDKKAKFNDDNTISKINPENKYNSFAMLHKQKRFKQPAYGITPTSKILKSKIGLLIHKNVSKVVFINRLFFFLKKICLLQNGFVGLQQSTDLVKLLDATSIQKLLFSNLKKFYGQDHRVISKEQLGFCLYNYRQSETAKLYMFQTTADRINGLFVKGAHVLLTNKLVANLLFENGNLITKTKTIKNKSLGVSGALALILLNEYMRLLKKESSVSRALASNKLTIQKKSWSWLTLKQHLDLGRQKQLYTSLAKPITPNYSLQLIGSLEANNSSAYNPFYNKIVNNIYCLSHRELWDQEKDWQFFALYYFATLNLEDIAVPVYNYRNYDFSLLNTLFSKEPVMSERPLTPQGSYKGVISPLSAERLIPLNLDISTNNPSLITQTQILDKQNLNISFSGAGIIQTLLAEYDYFELKKMDKQNRILLYDLNKYLRRLKRETLYNKSIQHVSGNAGVSHISDTADARFSSSLHIPSQEEVTYKKKTNPLRGKLRGQNKKIFKEVSKQRDALIRKTKLIRKIFRNYMAGVNVDTYTQTTQNSSYLQGSKTAGLSQGSLEDKMSKQRQHFVPTAQKLKEKNDPIGVAATTQNFSLTSMVLTLLPVLPPDLRPIVKMGSQIAASDLNRLYQRVIYRNDRLKKFLKDPATNGSYEMKYAQRLLQEAVDNLIQNGKSGVVPEKDARGRALKSLSDLLKGKQGRFRQYLLGKRVDYSGRSVIVVGPKLKLHECGIPKEMALELFLPFLIKRILNQNYARTVIGAKTLIQNNKPLTWALLREIMKTCPVLLNRAPTLHRLGFQAFQPKLVDGRAILLHPLACPAFNADFDGDQMAVHVPITVEARTEAWKLMLARNNLLSPATGEPLVLPSQDMVLGCYYLTTHSNIRTQHFEKGYGMFFNSLNDVLRAYNQGMVNIHSIIWVKWNGILENSHDLEQPLEIRINKKGYTHLIGAKTHTIFYLQNNRNINTSVLVKKYNIIRTTPGKILFNTIIQKSLSG